MGKPCVDSAYPEITSVLSYIMLGMMAAFLSGFEPPEPEKQVLWNIAVILATWVATWVMGLIIEGPWFMSLMFLMWRFWARAGCKRDWTVWRAEDRFYAILTACLVSISICINSISNAINSNNYKLSY